MRLEELQTRLTRHLAGEESNDFHTVDARLSAIREGYEYITEEYDLYAPGQASPPDLTHPNDQPWGGQYKPFHAAISFYAAFRLYQDKGPEMYERAQYWKSLFDNEIKEVAGRYLKRKEAKEGAQGEASEETWGGLQKLLKFYLDTSDLLPEEATRLFPLNARQAALRRAYRDMTVEHELSIGSQEMVYPGPLNDKAAYSLPVPADYLAPLSSTGIVEGRPDMIGGQYPYVDSYGFSVSSEENERRLVIRGVKGPSFTMTFRYVATPPALVNQGDKPWNGLYSTGNKLIAIRAMRDMFRGKRELYQLSRFWQNEYDREVVEFKKMLRRSKLGQANRVYMGHQGNMSVHEDTISWGSTRDGNGGNY